MRTASEPRAAPAGRRRLAAAGVTALLAAGPAAAVELDLEGVTGRTADGEVALRVASRARFDYDPAAGVLTATGAFTAEYGLPNRLGRFAHQFDDLRVGPDGALAVRGYECLEGAFGAAFLAANLCGGYRFGANGIDEGGLLDDVAAGTPRAFTDYGVESVDWDGTRLTVSLANPVQATSQVFAERGLVLRLVATRSTPSAGEVGVR